MKIVGAVLLAVGALAGCGGAKGLSESAFLKLCNARRIEEWNKSDDEAMNFQGMRFERWANVDDDLYQGWGLSPDGREWQCRHSMELDATYWGWGDQ